MLFLITAPPYAPLPLEQENINHSESRVTTCLVRLVLGDAICLADSFEFTIHHCMRMKHSDTNEQV